METFLSITPTFFYGSEIDPQIYLKWWNKDISFVMVVTAMKHKEEFEFNLLMHSSINLIFFVKLKMSFFCLSNFLLLVQDWRYLFHEV